jgi:hypothetical protein
MDNIDYNALFEIETGEDAAEDTDSAAETADNAPEEGREAARETQDGQEQGTDTDGASQPAEGREKDTGEKKPEQTPEERVRQAWGRRRREAEEAGRKAAMQEMNEVISRMGFTDPATGEAVDTAEKLKAYEAKLRKGRFDAGKPTEADVRAVAREELQRETGGTPQSASPTAPLFEGRQALRGDGDAGGMDPRIRRELEQIREMDPEMADLGAILRSEAGERFRGYVSKGLGFLDAYKLAAEERLASLRQNKAAEAARLQAASKDHLSATKAQGTGAESVPGDIAAQYRVFFPEATAAEIQRMYAADLKKMKR